MASQQWTGGAAQAAEYEAKLKDFESRVDKSNPEAMNLIDQMKAHTADLTRQLKNQDPRLSFSTPEFKKAAEEFTKNFKNNFGKPVEYGLVKQYPWQQPVLMKLERPVDVDGNPWPLDAEGKPIVEASAQ